MSYPIKAQVGDYIRIDGRVLRVVFVNDRDEQPEYELENGSCIGNRDFSYDDVLLESEVPETPNLREVAVRLRRLWTSERCPEEVLVAVADALADPIRWGLRDDQHRERRELIRCHHRRAELLRADAPRAELRAVVQSDDRGRHVVGVRGYLPRHALHYLPFPPDPLPQPEGRRLQRRRDIRRRAGNGCGRRDPAEERRDNIPQPLTDQLTVGFVFGAGHAVQHHRAEQRLNRPQHCH